MTNSRSANQKPRHNGNYLYSKTQNNWLLTCQIEFTSTQNVNYSKTLALQIFNPIYESNEYFVALLYQKLIVSLFIFPFNLVDRLRYWWTSNAALHNDNFCDPIATNLILPWPPKQFSPYVEASRCVLLNCIRSWLASRCGGLVGPSCLQFSLQFRLVPSLKSGWIGFEFLYRMRNMEEKDMNDRHLRKAFRNGRANTLLVGNLLLQGFPKWKICLWPNDVAVQNGA